ncbi:aminotransferase class I/II-fold pyridoxal phosphate-dependent enzyme [Amycolatopsis sp. NBC_00345]|uniref:aminotransferase class I/II-fold pyridoxal phosphate-dependent enzyme n=1 Tax=Amycolatopsis sp. NBC_00345 TaxID=2975955 RepID=UPI002E26DD7F
MRTSDRGWQLTRLTGIRTIMNDIASVDLTAGAADAWINLSPGNPSHIEEAVRMWRELTAEALDDGFVGASTRYGPSRGTGALVQAVAGYFADAYGWDIGPGNVVVGPGSQLLAFAATTLYTGQGAGGFRRLALPRLPDYAGYQGLAQDHGGVVGVDAILEPKGERDFEYRVDLAAVGRLEDVGMFLLSNPANPTGGCVTGFELGELAATAARHDAVLVVDNAYGRPFPNIAPVPYPPLWHPHVLNLFTFSKAGLPGERIAFAVGPEHLVEPIVGFLANTALHAPQLMQHAAARALATRRIDELVTTAIMPHYRAKRLVIDKLLAEAMPGGLAWRRHAGTSGMFSWLAVDEDWFDDLALYEALKERGVFIVPGRHFFLPSDNPRRTRCFRLSLSAGESDLGEGVGRMAAALRELGSHQPFVQRGDHGGRAVGGVQLQEHGADKTLDSVRGDVQ